MSDYMPEWVRKAVKKEASGKYEVFYSDGTSEILDLSEVELDAINEDIGNGIVKTVKVGTIKPVEKKAARIPELGAPILLSDLNMDIREDFVQGIKKEKVVSITDLDIEKGDMVIGYYMKNAKDYVTNFYHQNDKTAKEDSSRFNVKTPVAFENWGSFFWIEDGKLMGAPMLQDGTMETDKGVIGEVTAPESQEFLDDINKQFGTSFKLEDFTGR